MKVTEWWIEEGIYRDKVDGKIVKLHRDYEDAWDDEFKSLYHTKDGKIKNIQKYSFDSLALLKERLEYIGKV